MKVTSTTLTLPGAHVKGENPLPFFRTRDHAKPLSDGGLLPQEREGFGYETAFRVLPYTMQNRYERASEEITLKCVVLENDCLRATFLCEYGARLYSLYDKVLERELLYVNPVFQPANLAIRNAWFSGGIEWNIGHFGHTFLTCEPLFFARCREADGTEFLRAYEYERCKGAFLQIDFHLPKGARRLDAHVCIHNSHKEAVPMYWWTNIAVEENRDVRVFSGTDQVIYIKPETMQGKNSVHGFSHGALPFLPTVQGLDATHPDNLPYSCEYFFQNERDTAQTWEVAAYNDGTMFWERSTPLLRYRKMFCWGNGRGGRHWQTFLTKKGTPRYLEIQGGVCPTQVHGCDIGAGEVWRFTQVFGGADVEETAAFGEWHASRDAVYGIVEQAFSQAELERCDAQYRQAETTAPETLLHTGSGWGALEALRDPSCVPAGLVFPPETLGEAQMPWKTLLETGTLMQCAWPVSWMIDRRWMPLMRAGLEKAPENGTLRLHYAVACYENDDVETGSAQMKQAYAAEKTPVGAVCLSQMAEQAGDLETALRYMKEATELCGERQVTAIAECYLKLLVRAKAYEAAWAYYEALGEPCGTDERVMLEVAPAAYELEKWAFLEGLFQRQLVLIREGENILTDLWYRKQARDWMQQTGETDEEKAMMWALANKMPPEEIDFRMSL